MDIFFLHLTLTIFLSFFTKRIVDGGVQRAPKYSATTALCELRARQEIQEWALRPIIGDGVATRMKLGNTLQQLDSAEDTQKPSSEIGFGNWVWALFGPPNLSVGLRVCLYFITFWLLNHFLITIDRTHFAFTLPSLHISPVNAFGPWHLIGN